jgi:diguanylate cyclase (GGDEF)-like protein
MTIMLLPATQALFKASHALQQAYYVWHMGDDSVQWLLLPDAMGKRFRLSACQNGLMLAERLCGRSALHRQDMIDAVQHSGNPWQLEFTTTDVEGNRCQLVESAVFGEDDGQPVVYGIIQDVSHAKREKEQNRPTGSYDEMTGLFNKFRLSEMLEHALAYTQRYKGSGAYLSIGIDRLSEINNSFGYETGDMVMINLCHRLRKTLRDSDVIGRIEGDRIGVILFNCMEADLEGASQRFLQAVNASPIDTPHGPLQVSISMGSVLFPRQTETVFDTLRRSEQALSQAKKLGRNRHVAYEGEVTDKETTDAQAMGAVIRRALREKQFCLAFQPILDIEDNRVEIYECLLRINRGKEGYVSAGSFIAVAEQLGLITSIDRYVLKLVADELMQQPGITLGFNISGLTVGDSSWLIDLEQYIQEQPDIAGRMVVEITETAAFDNTGSGADFVRTLRKLGCHVALDDFGAGYTSFRQLQALPVDYIKVDGSFVREFGSDETSQIFVRTILDLAKAFNLKVIAEGVETEEQKQMMRYEGISLQQGYLFARPTVEKPWLFGEAVEAPKKTDDKKLKTAVA